MAKITKIMETIKLVLANIIRETPSQNNQFKRNLLKEYLQIVVLDFIYIEGVKNLQDLKEKLLSLVSRIDSQSIRLDLEALVANADFVNNVSRNMKAILKREIEEKL